MNSTSLTGEIIEPDLRAYDHIAVAFSGGKDSLACVLHLIELGQANKMELHHHDVDGGEDAFMDWPCTRAYCRAIADELKLPLYFSYKEGGFRREMLRDRTPTAPIHFQVPGGEWKSRGGDGPPGTRLKFPQPGANLMTRWCSPYLKIDVLAAAIRGQDRFKHSRTLVITGERAQESTNRARYQPFEPHRADARAGRFGRHVDVWRPILHWTETRVWDALKAHGIVAHPGYHLGWGRLSCMTCIFGSPNQWASVAAMDVARVNEIAQYERAFGVTIHRKLTVLEQVEKGAPYERLADPKMKSVIAVAMSEAKAWDHSQYPLRVAPGQWELPAGAYGEAVGPT